ncbi:MAG: hypothetical protein COA86_10055 [Kangiella sp.]|nr:MAG: hypothetical protein COA86_10055 [Kangiella sp.]
MNEFNQINRYEDVLEQEDIQMISEGLSAPVLNTSVKNSMKERVMNRIMAECPIGGETSFAAQQLWHRITDKLEVKVLTQDLDKKIQTAYWRLAPGAVVPGHYHHNDEDCLVLEGDISFGDHHLYNGDFHSMKKGTTHPEMTTTHGALLYLKHDIHEDLSWLNS